MATPSCSDILAQEGGVVKWHKKETSNSAKRIIINNTILRLIAERKAVMIHMAMVKDQLFGKTVRKSYAKYEEILEMPNMLKIQKDSYKWFLEEGLREVFKDVGSITDFSGKLELSFLDFSMDEKPKYTIEECKERDATYAKPIKVRVRLRNTETDEIKEQEIFMGDFPIMTNGGTFVINGAERVIVSQIVRSPGMYYGHEVDKADQHTYTATVIPYRGAWLEYETDASDVLWVRIDKNRKLPITCLIRAMGVKTDEEIKELFGEDARILATIEKDPCKTREESLLEIYRRLRPGEPPTVETAIAHLEGLLFDARRYDVSRVGRYKFNKKMDIWSRLSGQVVAEPIVDPMTGEILAMPGEVLDRARAHEISDRGVNTAVVQVGDHLVKIFANDMVDMSKFVDFDPAEYGIREKVRFSVLKEMLDTVPADGWKDAIAERMDDLIPKHIIVDDILASINYLNCVAMGVGIPDDIDHLGNRRLRCVGEAAAEPVPHRLQPSGPCDPGAYDRAGSGCRYPPESDQHPSCDCGHQGVLRLQPPVSVHGSEQPPGRADPQASSVRSGPRRSEQRARFFRCPRCTLHPLRPYVPHRDSRRSQHRSDQLSGHLCQDQRLWLHRGTLPQGG